MSVRQVVLCLVSVVGLSGCASYTFQDTDYGSFAKAWANTHSCNEQGFIDSDVAASGVQHMKRRLSYSQHDQNRLNAAINSLSSNKPSISECRVLAMQIRGWEKQQAQQQQEINEMNRAAENFKNSMPKQTYCNRIGTQVFCNSY